jgi:hypothetical protein
LASSNFKVSPYPQRLAVHLERAVTATVLDPEVVADRQHLLAHLEVLLTAVLSPAFLHPVTQSHGSSSRVVFIVCVQRGRVRTPIPGDRFTVVPMAQPRVKAAGGLPAIAYVMRKAWGTGEFSDTLKRLKSKNTCKTCALGMGGQKGGMVNEAGHFPEVCKKSVQAQTADMQPAIPESLFRTRDLTAMRRLTSAEAENLGRLAFPVALRPGGSHFERITWDEAIRLAGAALRAASPDRTFWYASGRSGNESAFLMQLVARAYGSPNIHNCSFYCHNASTVALTDIYGSGTASTTLDDLSRADLVLIAGANPASNHPRLVTQLIKLRRRGGKVIVINPMSELGLRRFRLPSDARSLAGGSQVSDLYLQPRIGGDIALLTALLKVVRWDGGFVGRHTSGGDRVREWLADADLPGLAEASGVRLAQIREAAELISQSERGDLHVVDGTDPPRAWDRQHPGAGQPRPRTGFPWATGCWPHADPRSLQRAGCGLHGCLAHAEGRLRGGTRSPLRHQRPAVRSGHLRVDAGRPGWGCGRRGAGGRKPVGQ